MTGFGYNVHGFGSSSPAVVPDYIALLQHNSPYILVYPFTSAGFGTKFANPSTLPDNSNGGNAKFSDVAFSPSGSHLVVSTKNDMAVEGWAWSADGFGTKLSDPSSGMPSGAQGGMDFSPSGAHLALGSTAQIYPFDSNGFGTRIDQPSTEGNPMTDVKFSYAGDYVAYSCEQSPYVQAFPFDGSAFGTRVSGGSGTSAGKSICWARDDDHILMFNATSSIGFCRVYPFDGSFGTVQSNPSSSIGAAAFAADASPDGNFIALAKEVNPGGRLIEVRNWDNALGSKVSDPSTFLGGGASGGNDDAKDGYGVEFSPDGDFLAVCFDSADSTSGNCMTAWAWSASGFGNEVSAPGTIVDGHIGRGIAWGRIAV